MSEKTTHQARRARLAAKLRAQRQGGEKSGAGGGSRSTDVSAQTSGNAVTPGRMIPADSDGDSTED